MNRRTTRTSFFLAAAAAAMMAGMTQSKIDYPKTKKVEHVDDYHGTPVPDPYRWLEDLDAPDVREWIEAQNEVTFSYLESIPERELLRRRLTELWDYPRFSAPFEKAGLYFHFKNDGLQNQAVLYKQAGLGADPEPLVDPNRFSEDGTVALTTLAVTEDARLMVYGTSSGGSDWQEFRVREVETGSDRPDHLEWIKFSGASWTHDGRGFFYSRYPEPQAGERLEAVNLNQKIYYHRLGTPQSEDRLVYERPDQPEWGFDTRVTHDGRYAVISVWHGTDERNRVYYIDLENPEEPRVEREVVRLLDAFDATYSFVGNRGATFFFRTNRNAPRYRLVAIDLERPEPAAWREILPESEDVLQRVEIINQRLVALYLHDAHSRLGIFSLEGRHEKDLELPTLGTVGSLTGEPDDDEMFYSFESFLYPDTIYRYDFANGKTEVFRTPQIEFDRSAYVTEQVFYTSKDGTRVPMFLTHRKDLRRDGQNPTYLYAYGGFNISLTPQFSASNLVWLEMGGVYAQPNLRGGGEYGQDWHEAGMFDRKQNVFDDFIAAAEYLVENRYTSPAKLAIGGGSNGGLLVGAAMTQRPELFGAALPAVGVMDMLRFHRFTIGWAWVSEYGSADDPDQFAYLRAYSPYHNLERGTRYPATLVTTADHDDRVVPAHSFKFIARLQEVQAGEAPVLIRIQTRAGHGAGKPTRMIIEEQADRWAFLVRSLGMKAPLAD